MDSLRSIDKNSLSHTQFNDISRLNSVANLDYQVCNGGVAQYFDNGYDCYCEPHSEQDVAHFGKSEQVSQLQALARFGESVANPSTQSGSAVVPPMRRVAATLPAKPAT